MNELVITSSDLMLGFLFMNMGVFGWGVTIGYFIGSKKNGKD